ncbi:unnamed protein product [Miscanthus lutarioriparius]|uniref:Uncharacterized protein n=1 Tax=Miscanthus lutarioriparius TaxID=422564 RepID=A0A811R6X0_9POAL|nr:unnamed protein product [Miscanthus lutarioriparius]
MAALGGLEQWQKDGFFQAAEKVQESADFAYYWARLSIGVLVRLMKRRLEMKPAWPRRSMQAMMPHQANQAASWLPGMTAKPDEVPHRCRLSMSEYAEDVDAAAVSTVSDAGARRMWGKRRGEHWCRRYRRCMHGTLRWGFLDCAEREDLFNKDNMTRGDHPPARPRRSARPRWAVGGRRVSCVRAAPTIAGGLAWCRAAAVGGLSQREGSTPGITRSGVVAALVRHRSSAKRWGACSWFCTASATCGHGRDWHVHRALPLRRLLAPNAISNHLYLRYVVANAVVYRRYVGDPCLGSGSGQRRAWPALAFIWAFSLIALSFTPAMVVRAGGGRRQGRAPVRDRGSRCRRGRGTGAAGARARAVACGACRNALGARRIRPPQRLPARLARPPVVRPVRILLDLRRAGLRALQGARQLRCRGGRRRQAAGPRVRGVAESLT